MILIIIINNLVKEYRESDGMLMIFSGIAQTAA